MNNAIVAVIGAGASGTLTAAHLARGASIAQTPLEIMLIDPDVPGRGLAYRTDDPRHRLNVPARGMSAWSDDPGHFVRWLRRHVDVDYPEGAFAPRLHYAHYLSSLLEWAGEQPGVHVEHVATSVADLRVHGRRMRLSLADGTSRPADAVVMALGHGQPSTSWAPAALTRSPRFIADPWRSGAQPRVGRGDDVVLVGAGLTAADMAQRWGREGVRVHVVSRHGMLPLPHASGAVVPADLSHLAMPTTLDEARRMVFDAIRAAGGDWRSVIDGLRPLTQRIWQQFDEQTRTRFLATAVRRWDRARHRIDPALHDWLEQRRTEGSMIVHAATVADAASTDDQLRVWLTDGSVIDAAAVLNCTGTCTGVSTSDDPLLLNLLSSGLVQAGPHDLGFETDDAGRVRSANGTQPAVWTLGPLRRGQLWESTAIPEIRGQAAAMVRDILATVRGPQALRRPRDPYGLPISANGAAAAGYLDALGRILRVQSGAETKLAQAVAADPGFALGHAVLALLGTEWGAQVDIEAALDAAHASGSRADERERRFIDVATARVREPGSSSAAGLLAYIHAYPEDALAVSLAVPTIAFGGATEIPAEAWALVEGLAPAYGEDWWYRGLLAFTRQEQDRFAEAGELAARALSVEPAAGHAVHAKAHVHYETGDHRVGLTWLDRWIDTCGAFASHRAHFSWHAALHEIALGDDSAVRDRYTRELAPPAVSGVRALVDSAALLWRLRMVDGESTPGLVLAVLETVPSELLTEPKTPFVAMHSAIALAAAGDCRRLVELRRWAARQPSAPFVETISPLADALCDLVHDDLDRAADGLLALEGLDRVGGSAAQRDVVDETLLYCAVHSGRVELAKSIVTERLRRRDSPRERHRLQGLVGAASAV